MDAGVCPGGGGSHRLVLAAMPGPSPARTGSRGRPHRIEPGGAAQAPGELTHAGREQMMKFRSHVEPPEPMRGLEVPPEVVEALGGGKRPPVTITINGHSWKSRVAIMRGRYLLGLSNANRQAAGVVTGDQVEVEVELDAGLRVVAEPADLARALDADPVARTAYDRLSDSRKREHVRAIESAKKPQTRQRRIDKAVAMLRGQEPAGGRAARAQARGDHP
jgi:bacteriocin resistance YdeI/OmpD-like protein/uncharacterized protein DUF1905